MKLVVGLGNPGRDYARNRHNIGFMAVDAIAAAHGFGPWRGKFSAEIADGRLGTDKALLMKPQTYMNLSGDAVQAAMAFHKLAPGDVIVLHDELDLAPGKVRVKAGGGHAGHNGLRSIMAHVGPDFVRVRLGIGHPGDKRLVTPFVLGDFSKADMEWLDPLLAGIARGAPALAGGDWPGFTAALTQGRPSTPDPAAARPAAPAGTGAPAGTPEAAAGRAAAGRTAEADPRSALQRLADRFR